MFARGWGEGGELAFHVQWVVGLSAGAEQFWRGTVAIAAQQCDILNATELHT